MMPRRAFAPVVVSVSLAAALTGCGSNANHGEAARSTPSQTAAALTAATAKALAAAGILTQADLPGYTAAPQEHGGRDNKFGAAISACLGTPKLTYLARNFGTAFTKGELEIDSSVDIAPSTAAANAGFAAFTSAKAPACVKQILTALVSKSGVTVTSFTFIPQPVTVPGSDASFAYALDLAVTKQGQTIRISGYQAGALVGQAEVSLSSLATSNGLITLPQVTALLTTAVGRVRAAS